MKKLTYLFAAAAMMSIVACSGGKGYVISGTVDGGIDGDTVYLQEVVGRQLVNLDTTTIKNGKFEFKGIQDSTVYRYLSHEKNGQAALRLDFFLENGKIAVALAQDNNVSTGTPNNDAYQLIRSQVDELRKKAQDIYVTIDRSLPMEENKAKIEQFQALQGQVDEVTKQGVKTNITNPVGVALFKQSFYNNTLEENDSLLNAMPAQYKNDERIAQIQETIDKQKLTQPGKKFINFEMANPEGKMVQLSD